MRFKNRTTEQLRNAAAELARHLEARGPVPKFAQWCKAVAAELAAVRSEMSARRRRQGTRMAAKA
jgi:hypothetical protein